METKIKSWIIFSIFQEAATAAKLGAMDDVLGPENPSVGSVPTSADNSLLPDNDLYTGQAGPNYAFVVSFALLHFSCKTVNLVVPGSHR